MFEFKIVEAEEVKPVVAAPVAAPAVVVPSALDNALARLEALQAKQEAVAKVVPVAPVMPQIDPTDALLDPISAQLKVTEFVLAKRDFEANQAREAQEKASQAVLDVIPDAREFQKSAEFKAALAASPSLNKLYTEGLVSVNADNVILALELAKARGASTVANTGNTEVTVASNATGVPMVATQSFSRSALERMQRDDPEGYARMSDQVLEAYRNGNITA